MNLSTPVLTSEEVSLQVKALVDELEHLTSELWQVNERIQKQEHTLQQRAVTQAQLESLIDECLAHFAQEQSRMRNHYPDLQLQILKKALSE